MRKKRTAKFVLSLQTGNFGWQKGNHLGTGEQGNVVGCAAKVLMTLGIKIFNQVLECVSVCVCFEMSKCFVALTALKPIYSVTTLLRLSK